jgi:hypothetical protein
MRNLPALSLLLLLLGVRLETAMAFRPTYPKIMHCTPESSIVKACFNKYMEKDIEEIIGIMYPNQKSVCSPTGELRSDESERSSRNWRPTKDMVGLVHQCTKLWGVYECLEAELVTCEELNLFFFLRHVLYSMQIALSWLCGQLNPGSKSHKDNMHQEVQERFSVLLENVHCMECVRVSEPVTRNCYGGNTTLAGDTHIWLQILRLERGPEICSELQKQLNCLWTMPNIDSYCGKNTAVYKNVTSLFINSWCDEHPFRGSKSNRQQFQQYLSILGLLFYFILN